MPGITIADLLKAPHQNRLPAAVPGTNRVLGLRTEGVEPNGSDSAYEQIQLASRESLR